MRRSSLSTYFISTEPALLLRERALGPAHRRHLSRGVLLRAAPQSAGGQGRHGREDCEYNSNMIWADLVASVKIPLDFRSCCS